MMDGCRREAYADYLFLRRRGLSIFRAAKIAIRTERMLRECRKVWATRAQREGTK